MRIFLVLFNKFHVYTKINAYFQTSYYYHLNNNIFFNKQRGNEYKKKVQKDLQHNENHSSAKT